MKDSSGADGVWLKRVRTQAGLSQRTFGKLIGITGSAVSAMENGQYRITAEMRQRVVDAVRDDESG